MGHEQVPAQRPAGGWRQSPRHAAGHDEGRDRAAFVNPFALSVQRDMPHAYDSESSALREKALV